LKCHAPAAIDPDKVYGANPRRVEFQVRSSG
jgi:hypothetical protein